MTSLEFKDRELFEKEMEECIRIQFPSDKDQRLSAAANYSISSGGKRFRPALCFAAAHSLGLNPSRIVHWAIAIEWIHTYSLIHDDLPMMDNDDFRRGQPTSHKKFDEATALLTGDALLTEGLGLVASRYKETPKIAIHLVQSLSQAAGARGMVLGQVMDFYFSPEKGTENYLSEIHNLKTGGLIGLCFEGAAWLAGKDSSWVDSFKNLGVKMGLAFQIKDDLLDADKNEAQSFLNFKSPGETCQWIDKISQEILDELSAKNSLNQSLENLVIFNRDRTL